MRRHKARHRRNGEASRDGAPVAYAGGDPIHHTKQNQQNKSAVRSSSLKKRPK